MDEHPPGHQSSQLGPAWMIIFADLVLLLLTFFVLLFSMSHVKSENWQAVVETLSRRLSPESATARLEPTDQRNVRRVFVPKLLDLDYLDTMLAEKMSADPVLARGVVQRLDDRVVVSLPGDQIFVGGSAQLTAGGRRAALALSLLLEHVDNAIEVDGHTDSTPHRSDRYPSNWEFSLARAVALARALREAGLKHEITAIGLADSRLGQITRALPRARRHELARRIDVVIRDNASKRGSDDP